MRVALQPMDKTRKDNAVTQSLDSFKCRKKLKVGNKTYIYYSLKAAEKNGLKGVSKLPFSLKVLLENLLRFEDGVNVTRKDVEALLDWNAKSNPEHEISFTPARVIMQDFTGVPCVVDLAAMREAIRKHKRSGPLNTIPPKAKSPLAYLKGIK